MEDLTVAKKESNSSIQLVQILRVDIKKNLKSHNQIVEKKELGNIRPNLKNLSRGSNMVGST